MSESEKALDKQREIVESYWGKVNNLKQGVKNLEEHKNKK